MFKSLEKFVFFCAMCHALSQAAPDPDVEKVNSQEEKSRVIYPNDFMMARPELGYHHHHHHGPAFHGQVLPKGPHEEGDFGGKEGLPGGEKNSMDHHHGPDFHGQVLPKGPHEEGDFGGKENLPGGEKNSSMEIPLDFIKNINEYNVSDLLLNFVEGEENYEGPSIMSRFGEDSNERNAAQMPKPATCMPELKTVPIVTSTDPSVLYIPQCTKIERCGGCCTHTLLSCQPKETETVTYQVLKTQYTGGKKLRFIEKEIVLVEKHTKCGCDCKVKASDCNKYQEYRKNECRCACTNMDEEKKCYKNSARKLWNPELCACQCREIMQCSTGYSFNNNECRCMPAPMKRRFINYERKGYVSDASEVSPLFDPEF